jgi:uncharacterized protein YbaR (Trm112 family)
MIKEINDLNEIVKNILACPECKGDLYLINNEIIKCSKCKLIFTIENKIFKFLNPSAYK